MPIFEYRCLECSERFEVLVLNSDEAVACSACDSGNLEKQFSSFGVKSDGGLSPSSQAGLGSGCCGAGCGCGVKG